MELNDGISSSAAGLTLTRRLMLRYSDRGRVTQSADAVMMNSRLAMIVYLAHAAHTQNIHNFAVYTQYIA